ncbi:hypothetical protein EVAR_17284_1 [Eumeta japonica]|uniref:Uncharacterized protein n=1 Tax=Eumeta variegata TaxID=151549 RepID=A0A4C1TT16_EUMVA|nr:hypothetical protein EVAR_17284_1 [Eumeta japonica]
MRTAAAVAIHQIKSMLIRLSRAHCARQWRPEEIVACPADGSYKRGRINKSAGQHTNEYVYEFYFNSPKARVIDCHSLNGEDNTPMRPSSHETSVIGVANRFISVMAEYQPTRADPSRAESSRVPSAADDFTADSRDDSSSYTCARPNLASLLGLFPTVFAFIHSLVATIFALYMGR